MVPAQQCRAYVCSLLGGGSGRCVCTSLRLSSQWAWARAGPESTAYGRVRGPARLLALLGCRKCWGSLTLGS